MIMTPFHEKVKSLFLPLFFNMWIYLCNDINWQNKVEVILHIHSRLSPKRKNLTLFLDICYWDPVTMLSRSSGHVWLFHPRGSLSFPNDNFTINCQIMPLDYSTSQHSYLAHYGEETSYFFSGPVYLFEFLSHINC